ncbi:MAG: DNRLRE domain-containing protein [Phycisphaerales bacterium]|nr:DNRLRE domain-containing protein [Phycisphaerales bacterium]
MKKLLILIIIFPFYSLAQKTVKLKPGAAYGEDVELATNFGCTPSTLPAPPETLNFGTAIEINYAMWTYSFLGCGNGTQRSLIRFKGLDTLPSSATILSAKLYFYGVSTSGNWGTSYFSGSPYPLTNEGWIERVTGSWTELGVTWNTQPTTTTTNRAAIGVSSSRFGWNTNVDVTTLVNDIKTSGVNNGFMLRLNTEGIYRRVTFASSDNTDSTLWPELVITYTVCASATADFKDTAISCYQYQFTDLSSSADTGIATWNWDFGDGTTSTAQNPLHTFPGYGPYSVRLIATDSNGCIHTMIKSVNIKYTHFANAGFDVTLCLTNGLAATLLNGKGGVNYSWTPATGLSAPTSASTSAVVSVPTTYYLNVIDSFGCIDNDTVKVGLFQKPNIVAAPKNIMACLDETIKLSVSGAKTYAWFPPSGLDSSTIATPTVKVIGNIKYIVQGTDANGCIGYDTVTIGLKKQLNVTVNPKTIYGCLGDEIQLNATGATYYKWYPPIGLNSDTIANPEHIIDSTQTYVLRGYSVTTCDDYDTVFIGRYPSPNVDAYSMENVIHCRGNGIRLNVTGASRYEWSPAEYCDDKTSTSPTVKPTQTTIFTVKGTNDNGCSATDTISVIYDGKTMVYLPNAFTPNNDQSNDQIGVVDQCNFILYSFYIFNRWGQNVFSGYDIKSRWDGTFNGKECEMGIYFYQIRGKSLDQEEVIFSGDFTLIR